MQCSESSPSALRHRQWIFSVAVLTCLSLSLNVSLLAAPSPPVEDKAPPDKADDSKVLLREVYVPYDVFHSLKDAHPDGVVMHLAEYRELVLKAELESRAKGEPRLPPLGASVVSVAYEGRVRGSGRGAASARFTARLQVQVARDGWVFCDLGGRLPALGSVRVDGAPGWLVVGPPPTTSAGTGSPAKRQTMPDPHTFLILRGRGLHEVVLSFVARVSDEGEEQILQSPLIRTASATLELTVPGRASGTAQPDRLHTEASDEATRFRMALGETRHFRLAWRGRRTVDENPVLLAAEHAVTLLPRPGSPRFAWQANLRIGRQKIDTLVLTEAPGMTVLDVRGDLLHSWERLENGVRAVLKEPVTGSVQLRLEGLFELEGDTTFSLRPPGLAGAYSNRGYLTVLAPRGHEVTVQSSSAVEEISATEGAVASLTGGDVARAFRFSSGDAAVDGNVSLTPTDFATRAAYVLSATERTATLLTRTRIDVSDGRVYTLTLRVPAPWMLASLAAEAIGGEAPPLSYEEVPSEDGPLVRIELDRAATPERPVQLLARYEHASLPPERAWDTRQLALSLPALEDAARIKTSLSVALSSSLDLETTNLPQWRSLPPGDLLPLELSPAGRVVALLETEALAPAVDVTLAHRPARGEYRSVTHVLAAEKQLRVRVDVRLAVVDRGIDSLTFRLPSLPADAVVLLLGKDVQEPTHQNVEGLHTVRFAKPWIGSRQFRIEYEVAHTHGPAAVIPDPLVDGNFGSERFLVLQSRGAVAVLTDAGPGLAPIDWDDIPDFAAAWPEGRVLDAYRFRERAEPGTFRTVLHASAPLLSHLVQKMELTSLVGTDGTVRTEADLLLGYARNQYLTVELPLSSRVLAVRVDGKPVRAVRSEADTETKSVFSIPLPPQSYARVTITYEQPAGSGENGSQAALGRVGTWSSVGPTLRDIPVGETTWRIFHPEGYRFYVAGGNLSPVRPAEETRVGAFSESFFSNLARGRNPRLTVLEWNHPVRPTAKLPALSDEELQGARKSTEENATRDFHILRPQGRRTTSDHAEAPFYRLLPRGRFVEIHKVGGDPAVELSYQTFTHWHASKRGVFLGTLLLGFLLFLRSRRSFWRLATAALVLGTLVPEIIAWESPLLMIPLCEGLAVLLICCGTGTLLTAIWRRTLGAHRPAVAARVTGAALVLSIVAGASTPGTVHAQASEAIRDLPAQAELDGFDVVWIPYSADGLPGSTEESKAYLSRERFRELWRLAHPEDEKTPEFPHAYVLGPARYRLRIDGDSFHLVGTVPLHVFSTRWVTVQLPFHKAQPTAIRLDGTALGVSQKDGTPFVELKGQGDHQLEVTLEGRVTTEQGRFLIESELLPGLASTITAELPAGAEVKSESTPLPFVEPASAETPEARTLVTVDAGASASFRLLWSIPRRGEQQDSQAESLSYTALSLELDGMGVGRRERLTVKGQPLDQATYRIAGNWEIADVVGPDVAEWSITEEDDSRLLRVYFSRPLSSAELGVYGQLVAAARTELPTLVLENAARAESYVAVYHGSGRRFLPDILNGMDRASYATARQLFSFPQGNDPDRVYHTYGSGEGESLQTTAEEIDFHVVTDAVLVIQRDRQLLFGRSRYTKARPGPLRYRMRLPPGVTVRRVDCGLLRSWHIVESDDHVELVVELRERPNPGTEVTWSAERVSEALPPRITLPFLETPRPDGASLEQTVRVAVAAEKGLELRSLETARWEPLALEQAATWVPLSTADSYRFAFRSKRPDSTLVLGATPRSSELTATTISMARVSDDALHVNARLIFQLRSGSENRFRLRLPTGTVVESIETRNLQSRSIADTPGGVVVEVTLQSPAVADHTLDLVYHLPRDTNAIPGLLPIVVENTAGRVDIDAYVGIVRTARTVTLRSETAGLAPIELGQLPYVPFGVSEGSIAESYRATTSNWTLALFEQEIELADSFDAVIELIDLATLVGGDGTRRTRATYTLRKGGLQFLGVRLPAGASLWGVTVNGRSVAVGQTANANPALGLALRIPVDGAGKTDLPVEVRLYYEEPSLDLPDLRETFALSAPRLLEDQSIRVVKTLWSFRMPDGYAVSASGGNMRLVPTSLKHAEKIEQLLERKAKVLSVVKGATSKRKRARAQKDLARLEQSLGDNLAELEGTNRSVGEKAQVDQIGEHDLTQQWFRNDLLIVDARGAQQELRQERERQSQEEAPSTDEQAFEDRFNFRAGRDWSLGKAARKESKSPPPPLVREMDALLEPNPFAGWSGLTRGMHFGAEAEQTAAQAPPAGGLKALPDAGGQTNALALEPPNAVTGQVTYTFRHTGGDATVNLQLTKRDTVPRLAAAALLACIALGWGALRFRRR